MWGVVRRGWAVVVEATGLVVDARYDESYGGGLAEGCEAAHAAACGVAARLLEWELGGGTVYAVERCWE